MPETIPKMRGRMVIADFYDARIIKYSMIEGELFTIQFGRFLGAIDLCIEHEKHW
jgi:hypothetical protein